MDVNFVDAYIATAELALTKHDYAMAAKNLDQAQRIDPDNAQIAYLQALAWQDQDPVRVTESLERAIALNPNHVPSLLLLADRAIDSERFDIAEGFLTDVLAVNRFHPQAWAYHAVIAHLQGHHAAERLLRQIGLEHWNSNPSVDRLIGRKLSRHYRFAEAAEYQRRSLAKQPDDPETEFYLAQDLLRLGRQQDGWSLVKQVQQKDPYHVVAHNLTLLYDRLAEFTTLESDGFVVRMDTGEAAIYGTDVLDLLAEARTTLTEKYDVGLEEPTFVEIFPRQSDFAIRTFGLPGGDGFLGVCFGRLITANSPASQRENPTNWKSVLWHEFCHVVTLQKTRNRMPRWLSEGISVYEELQRDATWGQQMTPTYRRMILGDDFVPCSRLSEAFLQAKSPLHLQFAYFQSSLAVRYIIEEHGFDTLLRLLDDLSVGLPMNEALTRRIGSLKVIDQQFETFAKDLAKAYGKPEAWHVVAPDQTVLLTEPADDPFAELLMEQLPTAYETRIQQIRGHLRDDEFDSALSAAEQTEQWFATDEVPLEVLDLKAQAAKRLAGDDDSQARKTWMSTIVRIADRASDRIDAYRTIATDAIDRSEWELAIRRLRQWTDVDPLDIDAQKLLADVSEQLRDDATQLRSINAMLHMQPVDPAGLYYNQAMAHDRLDQPQSARRSVLQALELAPRYRSALKLLLQLNDARLNDAQVNDAQVNDAK